MLLGSDRPRTAEPPPFTQVAPHTYLVDHHATAPQRLIGHGPPTAAMGDHVAGLPNAPRNARSYAADEVRHISRV